MGFFASSYQIVQLAIKAEEAGESYYKNLAGKLPEGQVKQVCLWFAEQEREHLVTFKKISTEIPKDAPSKEYSIDVMALLNDGIRMLREAGFQPGPVEGQSVDLKKMLEIALTVEKTTILLYQNIQSSFLDVPQIVFYRLIKEESEHAETIQNVIKKVCP